MKTEPTINIQSEVAKIHSQYGTTEMANYRIEKLLEKYIEQSSPKIKQLEWVESDGEYWEAITRIGTYSITFDSGSYVTLYDMDDAVDAEWRSLAKAKSAAQADFEKRVMECLDIADNSNK